MFIKTKAFVSFAQIFRSNANGTKFLCMYSSSSSPSLEQRLVDSLGFTTKQAITASAKVSPRKSSKNPHLVLDFLKQTGLSKTHMKKLVLMAPDLLYRNVNKTLKPKFHWLQELGFSGSELVDVLVRDTSIVTRSLRTHLKPKLDCLREILGSNEDVLKAIRRSVWLLTFGGHKTFMANVLMMQNFGLSKEQIRKLVLRQPNCLLKNPKRTMDSLRVIENDFGLPRTSPMFIYGFSLLVSISKSRLDMKMKILKRFGWSDSDVLKLFSKMPGCFGQSGARLEKVLNIFMKELGFKPAYLADRPAILAYNLDKRVVPRIKVLRILEDEKLSNRKLTLYPALTLSESKFVEKFVLPYKDQVPDMYESYKKTMLS